jgi:hypothetical protein
MKSNFFKYLLKNMWIAFLVFLVFMAMDFLFYGLSDMEGYKGGVVDKSIWTLIFAFIFTIVYHSASNWRPKEDIGKITSSKLINSIAFSLFVSVMLIAVISLSGYLLMDVYVFLLDGIRGIPDDGRDTGILVGKVIVGGVTVELCGRDETDVPRTGG